MKKFFTILTFIFLLFVMVGCEEGSKPIDISGITFEGGYSSVIVSGDADFITKDTLWDFKVSKNSPTSKQTLQLLIRQKSMQLLPSQEFVIN